jgi:hypothetical protein
MARGLPAIGSAVGGIRELLPGDHLFDPRDANAMLGLMRQFMDPPRYRHGAATCNAIAEGFAADLLSQRRRALYYRLREIATRAEVGPLPERPALAGSAAR